MEDDKMLACSKISDINFNGANIVVSTLLEYRGLGYGKLVVSKAIEWCIKNKVLPIYWVDSKNAASINLAKSLGFEMQAEELVVSTEI